MQELTELTEADYQYIPRGASSDPPSSLVDAGVAAGQEENVKEHTLSSIIPHRNN